MTEREFVAKTAGILVYGHIGLFLYGLFGLATFGRMSLTDVTQTILMGTPVLAIVSVSAFSHIVDGNHSKASPADADPVASKMIFRVCYAFIASLFFTYSLGIFPISGFDADIIRMMVGAIETVLGAYIAVIRDKIFPSPPTPAKPQEPGKE